MVRRRQQSQQQQQQQQQPQQQQQLQCGGGGGGGSGKHPLPPADPDSLLFAAPHLPTRRKLTMMSMSCNMSSVSAAVGGNKAKDRAILLVELPAEVLVKILGYLSFNHISGLRMVRTD